MPSTVHPEIIDLARRIASAHGLEPALVCAVIEQESAWNPWASVITQNRPMKVT
jgi:soluble lytic murein transglycosylase-like protein